jgi:hypothetical protein
MADLKSRTPASGLEWREMPEMNGPTAAIAIANPIGTGRIAARADEGAECNPEGGWRSTL